MAANVKMALDTGCGEPKWTRGDSRNLRNGNQLTTDNCPCGTSLGSANGCRKPSEWVPLSILLVELAGSYLPSLDQVSRCILTTSMFRTFIHFQRRAQLWTCNHPRKNTLHLGCGTRHTEVWHSVGADGLLSQQIRTIHV